MYTRYTEDVLDVLEVFWTFFYFKFTSCKQSRVGGGGISVNEMIVEICLEYTVKKDSFLEF